MDVELGFRMGREEARQKASMNEVSIATLSIVKPSFCVYLQAYILSLYLSTRTSYDHSRI